MKRLTLALLAVCAAGVGSATVVFSDGFETGDFRKWTLTGTGAAPTIVTDRVRSGGFAAHRGTVAGQRYQADFDPLGQPIVRLSAWVFDPGLVDGARQFLELRALDATGALHQLWAIGVHNSVTAPGTWDRTRYQGRIAFSLPGVTAPGWFNLTSPRLTTATAGWTHFQIEVDPTHSRFLVDGVLNAEHPRISDHPITRVVLNTGLSSSGYETWIDDVSVEAVPEPASLLVLGAGALALLRRRKR